MAKVERIKRRLVRQVVRDNLDLLEGRTSPRRPPRPSPLRSIALGAGLAFLLSLGILASSHAVTGRTAISLLADPASGSAEAPSLGEERASLAEEREVMPGPPPPEPASPEPEPVQEEPAPVLVADPQPVAHQVFPLAVRRVVLDAGHGGDSLGTRTPTGLTEKELTLDVSRRLESLLVSSGFEVLMTRREDRSVALEERARYANLAEADLFVSIHVNWIADGAGTRGVETYYLGTTDDPYLTELAAKENRDSGYSLADMRRLLDRIYSDLRGGKSRELAQSVQSALHHSLSKVNPHLQDRGVKTAPFLVLVETEMPAILAEVSCLSNQKEAELLAKPLYRQFIAEALARGIETYAGASRTASGASTAGP